MRFIAILLALVPALLSAADPFRDPRGSYRTNLAAHFGDSVPTKYPSGIHGSFSIDIDSPPLFRLPLNIYVLGSMDLL